MEKFFTDFLAAVSPALQTLILSLATVFAAQIVAYVNKQIGIVNAELSTNQQYFLQLIISDLMQAAQQIYKESSGDVKKAYVVSRAQALIKQSGLNIDIAAISSAVEAEYYKNFNKE